MLTLACRSLKARLHIDPILSPLVTVLAVIITAAALLKTGPTVLLALFLLPWFVILFHYYPVLLPMLWTPLFFLETVSSVETLELSNSHTNLPILLSFTDIAYFFTLIYLISECAFRPNEFIRVVKKNPYLTLFLVIVLISAAIYMPLYGKRAIGEARKFYFCFFFPLLTMLSVKSVRDLRIILFSIMAVGIGIIMHGLYNFLRGVFIEDVLYASPALFLLLSVFTLFVFKRNGQFIINWYIDYTILIASLGLIAVTQHRSVIMAGGFGLFIMLILYRIGVVFVFKMTAALIVLLTIAGVVLTFSPKAEQSLIRNLSGIVNPHQDGTASWRIQGWQQQLSRLSGKSLLFGEGLGSYYHWSSRKTGKVTAAPHNAYVQLILKFGLTGLLIYLLVAYKFFHTALTICHRLQPGSMRAYVETGILNFGASHAFFMGYGFGLPMMVYFGLAMGAVMVIEKTWASPIGARAQDISELPDRPIVAYAGLWK